MSEYGVDFPVWDLDQALGEDYEVSADRLNISDQLTANILVWQRLFDENFHWEDGWRDPAARDEYADRGRRLQDRLQAELGRDVDVVLDLWPVKDA